ncbi:MAG: hypothetical protein IPF52_16960 [Saprospiraceae bacterium]|nr:hypothetical protein [Saprospiraceae bacterium]
MGSFKISYSLGQKYLTPLIGPNEDLARLLHLIGEASDSEHNYDGTSTYSNNSLKTLTDHYHYSNSITVARSQ